MPTLGEACAQLRIGRVTLAKWIQRLGIETTRHEVDYRYEVIAPEDVERIAEARRKLPQVTKQPVIHTDRTLAFDRRSTADGERATTTDSFSPLAPTPRPRQPRTRTQFEGSLPDGLVSIMDVAETHGILRYLTTLYRWQREGKLDCAPVDDSGGHGHFTVKHALTQRGLAQFYQLASHKEGFRACSACPHQDNPQERAPGGGDE